MNKIKILFLSANPDITTRLKLDEEIRAISKMIRASEHRDMLEIQSVWAIRPDDLLQALNEHKPHIVHFSGHGSDKGEIILVDDDGSPKPVTAKAIRALFKTLKDNIRIVVLNACFSRLQASAVTEVIDCAVGMNTSIGDDAAITFATSFYRALGFGRSVRDAFEQGKTALMLEGIAEENTPELLAKPGIDLSKMIVVADEKKEEYEKPLFDGPWLVGSTLSMKAVEKWNSSNFTLRAHPIGSHGIIFRFDVTNPNRLDLRVVRFYIDVVDFIKIEIRKVWASIGAAMPIRKFACAIRSEVGRYECTQISESFDYIRLSEGEMEFFGIEVTTNTEGFYRLRIGMEYSIGGTHQQIQLDNAIKEIGFFDDNQHKIRIDWRSKFQYIIAKISSW